MKYNITPLLISISLMIGCEYKPDTVVSTPAGKGTVISKEPPAGVTSFSKNKGGACGFDKLQIEGDHKFISGWALISKDTVATGIYLGILVNDVERFTPILKREVRDDVAKHFDNKNILQSGFASFINDNDTPRGSKISLYQVFQGVIYPCEVTMTL